MGGPLINVFLMVYFDDVFRFCFLVFIGIIGWTPDKRISEGLFSPVFFFYLFFFLVFQSIIGGTPDKRISEGLFCPVFFWLVFYRHFWGHD